MRKFILGLILFVSVRETAGAKDCHEKQGALDFGSGTTKAFAALVDVCQKKVIEVIFEDRLPLALNEALEKSAQKEIPTAIIDQALPQFQTMLQKMQDHDVKKIHGIATAVFRSAKNGPQVIQRIAKTLQIPVQIISQEKEAELGFWSAIAQKKLSPKDPIIVWDIGGGSMQMYARRGKTTHVFQGDLASVSFKNKILEDLQFKDPKQVSSPNPIGTNKDAALQIAKNHAYIHVSDFFKKEAVTARWIGVGGVLSMSVQAQTKKGSAEFTQAELDKTLRERVFLRDEEINSDYKISDISNLALVLGYMQALQIRKVETAQASLGQGLLLYNMHH
ncbi:MAG: hypothetical protein HUU57_12745 [Bdellovibrio sp.]|nr:hypothetical protein [Bdellovibrio sp.]